MRRFPVWLSFAICNIGGSYPMTRDPATSLLRNSRLQMTIVCGQIYLSCLDPPPPTPDVGADDQ
jgi:hypothetical protein